MTWMQSTMADTGFAVALRAHDPAPATDVTTVRWEAVRQDGPTLAGVEGQPLCGPICLAIGLGPHGAAWLDGLRRSSWFLHLTRTPADLAAGGKGAGCMLASRLLVSTGLLPDAPMMAVAIDSDGSSADHAAGLALVHALRQNRDCNGMRRTVVATLEHGRPDLARRLAGAGAFVVEGAPGVPASHLHHFPLRAATFPAAGRVICADLADHLVTWRPGTCSRLHLLPAEADIAARQLRRMVQDGRVGAGNLPLNLHVLGVSWSTGDMLSQMEDLWLGLVAVLGQHPSGGVLTSTEPLTDMGGWADLLIAS